jgi:hypothetical protein
VASLRNLQRRGHLLLVANVLDGSFVPPRLVGAIIGGQSERNVREHPSVNIWGTASEMCVCERE